MLPVVIRRQRKHEAEQAIKDLEARGFSCWIAKLRRVD